MPDDPLPLNVPTELVGKWFEPGDEDHPASGRLEYDPVEGLTLETVSDRPPFPRGDVPIMLGLTVDGRLVTLRDVSERHSHFNSRGGTVARARVRTAFIGMHADTPDEIRFWNLDARLSNLNDWCSKAGIDFDHAIFPRGGSIAFHPPAPIVIGRARGAVLTAHFDFDGTRHPARTERSDPYSVSLEQRAWLRIAPRRGRWPYERYDELLTRAQWFFGFAAIAQDELLELCATTTQRWQRIGQPSFQTRETVWILFDRLSLLEAERRPAAEMLLCLADLPSGEEARPLTRWLQLCDGLEMDPVFGPYFAALPTRKMYTDLRFVVFAQAAEAYDARRRPGSRKTKITFKTRVDTLVAGMPRELRRQIPSGFAEEVRDTRNFATHRDSKNRKRAATGARLFALSELVKFVFDVAILRELGFKQSEIVRLFNRNDRLTRFVNLMLRYMAETKPGR